jgi:hypothetical protein
MDEAEWLACTDSRRMLPFLGNAGFPHDRKVRLFAAAACRRIWLLMTDERCRQAVEAAERYADGEADGKALGAAWAAAWSAYRDLARASVHGQGYFYSIGDAERVRSYTSDAAAVAPGAEEAESAAQAALLRDILGISLFRRLSLDPSWLTPTVLTLATAAYDHRVLPAGTLEPERLAVLSDALEEAGCTDAEILGHLREPGPHVRGCFAVDRILDKK